ncbi:kinase-like protein [Rhizopogon salebrosus TDB-379]|nr:kinase-like protein [Rhizopogon salebrosus TDB-379]
MSSFALDGVSDLTDHITKLGSPTRHGSFSQVYRSTMVTSEGKIEVAVKVLLIDPERPIAEIEKRLASTDFSLPTGYVDDRADLETSANGVLREFKVWLRLRHSTIVPLLGIAHLESPLPALISQWMPSGTLYIYLEKQATTLTALAKDGLAKGVADGLKYLHSKNVIHGDLHPANVLIDDSGNPRLTDFGLATVVGEAELQWTTATVGLNFDCRWRAPEDIGVDCEPGRPTFKSDIYSFGGIMFFIVSGDIPWKEKKKSCQIIVELSRRVAHARPKNILDDHWNLIQQCWFWDPEDRPNTTTVLTNECWSASNRPAVMVVDLLGSEVGAPIDNDTPVREAGASHRPASLDEFDVEQTTAPDYNIRPTQLVCGKRTRHQHASASSSATLHPSFGVSTPASQCVDFRAGRSWQKFHH